MSYRIQSVLMPKRLYDAKSAKEWVIANGFKVKKVDETENFYRFRQLSPQYIERLGYTVYRTKKLKDGVELVIAYKEE